MSSRAERAIGLDVLGLFLAGLINTFLAPLDAGFLLGPGTEARQPDLLERVAWIAEHQMRWQGGWLFWFAVTLSFSWSYYALGRHLRNNRPWIALAVGVALIAAAVDVVGVLVNMVVLPELAGQLGGATAQPDTDLVAVFRSMEKFATALTSIAAFGLYSLAGLLLVPALFSTRDYPRWLAWLGVGEWSVAAFATVLLIFAPSAAIGPFVISIVFYGAWVWATAFWLLKYVPASRLLIRGAVGGFAGGAAMALFLMSVAISTDGFWSPIRGITSVALGRQHYAGEFDLGPVIAGLAGHTINSIIFGVLFTFVSGTFLTRAKVGTVVVAGAAFGLLVWAIMVPGVAHALQGSDEFVKSVPVWAWILGHVVFGCVVGLAASVGARQDNRPEAPGDLVQPTTSAG